MALKGLKKADQSSNQDQIEDFIKGCIDERNLKVKPESYIYSKLPDYNCEECEALPLVNPNELTEVIGYGIRGTAKKYDISQTPCKEIDSKKISFSIGKAGVFASNTNNVSSSVKMTP